MCSVGPPKTGQASVSVEVLGYFRRNGHAVSLVDKKIAPGAPKYWHYLFSLPQIAWLLLCRPRPRLAYLACSRSRGGFLRDALFIALCRLRHVPVINHVHGSDLPALLGTRVLGPLARRLLNGLSANVMLSYAMAVEAQQAGLANAAVLRNFAAPALFDLTPGRRDAGAPVRILFLSNVMQSKGVFDLIEACRRLADTAPAFELNIVGPILESDPATANRTFAALQQQLAQLRFVKWHGPRYDEEKLEAYRAADVFCLPSYAEAAPLSLLEAMAVGLPCVVTGVGGVPEIVTDGEDALLVPPQQPEVLARRLGEVIGSPELRRRLGDNARARARRHFTLAHFLSGLDEVVRAAGEVAPKGAPTG